MACHQSHAIPWQNLVDCHGVKLAIESLTGHLPIDPIKQPQLAVFVKPYKAGLKKAARAFRADYPHLSDIYHPAYEAAINGCRKKMSHFIKCFATAVDEFAKTERAKYSEKMVSTMGDENDVLYTDAEAAFYGDIFRFSSELPTNSVFQNVSEWVERQRQLRIEQWDGEAVALVVKFTMALDRPLPLLRLIRHGVYLSGHQCGGGWADDPFGWQRMMIDGVWLYVCANLAIAEGTATTKVPNGYHPEMFSCLNYYPMYTAQETNRVQLSFAQMFFEEVPFEFNYRDKALILTGDNKLEQARGLSKMAFRWLYLYQMIMSELEKSSKIGSKERFERELVCCLREDLHFKRFIDESEFPVE